MSKSVRAKARPSKPVLRLAPVVSIQKFSPTLSDATRACVRELERLLSLARQGRLHGLSYVAMERNDESGRYECDAVSVGDCWEHAIVTLGALAMLKHDLLAQADKTK